MEGFDTRVEVLAASVREQQSTAALAGQVTAPGASPVASMTCSPSRLAGQVLWPLHLNCPRVRRRQRFERR
jgi:hypothetical protein